MGLSDGGGTFDKGGSMAAREASRFLRTSPIKVLASSVSAMTIVLLVL